MKELKDILLERDFIDNNFLDIYCELIKLNENKKEIKNKTQEHHGIPVCWFRYHFSNVNDIANHPRRAKTLADNDPENVFVNVDYKTHLLLHYYLALCAPPYLKTGLENAFIRMTSRKYKLGTFNPNVELSEYNNLYEDWIKGMSDRKKGKSAYWNIGLKRSEEQKRNQSKKTKGRHLHPETEFKKGHKFPKEIIDKCANAHKKKVVCVETGEIFDGIIDATNKYKVNFISACCKGRVLTAAGYHWQYLEDYIQGKPIREDKKGRRIKYKGKIYHSISEAARENNIDRKTIYKYLEQKGE